ncbi:MAG: hypothetical protein ABIP56_09625 [Dokdonella sp.]
MSFARLIGARTLADVRNERNCKRGGAALATCPIPGEHGGNPPDFDDDGVAFVIVAHVGHVSETVAAVLPALSFAE